MDRNRTIAYLLKGFGRTSETFISTEMALLEEAGDLAQEHRDVIAPRTINGGAHVCRHEEGVEEEGALHLGPFEAEFAEGADAHQLHIVQFRVAVQQGAHQSYRSGGTTMDEDPIPGIHQAHRLLC